MKHTGISNQIREDEFFHVSGTLADGNPVLVLPRASSRTALIIANTGSSNIFVDFGYARAGAVTMTGSSPNQSVASVAVANAGQGYSMPPNVIFFGGGRGTGGMANPTFLGVPLPDELAPSSPAKAHCVMSGSAPNQTVASIAIDNPGSGYVSAPLCYLRNKMNDPNGCVAATTATSLIIPTGSAPISFDRSVCPTQPVVIVGTAGGTWVVKYMP